jgi:outer membrane receptor protein involved in Fe transport
MTLDIAAFGRVSEGGRANADRLLFDGGIQANGNVASEVGVNSVKQIEGGVKWRNQNTSLVATLFHATTKVTDQDITDVSNPVTSEIFEAKGLELEGSYYRGRFSLRSGLTYTLGEVTRNDKLPERVGNPVNQRLIFQFSPAWYGNQYIIGLNVIGSSSVPFNGGIEAPAYAQVNGFIDYAFDDNLKLVVTGNNLFNAKGITELPNSNAGVTENGVNTGRSINGRSIETRLAFTF